MLFFKSYALKNFKDFYDALLTLVTVEDQEVKDIVDNLDSSLKGIINYYFGIEVFGADDVDTKIEKFNSVTSDDIESLAKKIKIGITYFLRGEIDEKE